MVGFGSRGAVCSRRVIKELERGLQYYSAPYVTPYLESDSPLRSCGFILRLHPKPLNPN